MNSLEHNDMWVLAQIKYHLPLRGFYNITYLFLVLTAAIIIFGPVICFPGGLFNRTSSRCGFSASTDLSIHYPSLVEVVTRVHQGVQPSRADVGEEGGVHRGQTSALSQS